MFSGQSISMSISLRVGICVQYLVDGRPGLPCQFPSHFFNGFAIFVPPNCLLLAWLVAVHDHERHACVPV